MTFRFANSTTLAADILKMIGEGRSFSDVAAYICNQELLHVLVVNSLRQDLFSCGWTAMDRQILSLENDKSQEKVYEEIFKGNKAECDEIAPGVVFAPIIANGKTEALLYVKYEFPYAKEQAIMMAENLAKLYIFDRGEKQTDHQRSHFVTNRVARDLLLNMDNDDSDNSIYLRNIQRSFPKFEAPYAILCFSSESIENLEQAYSMIPGTYPNSFQIYIDNRIYVFLYALVFEKEVHRALFRNSLERFCNYYNLKCGVSQSFELLERRNWYRRQAKHALLTSIEETRVCFASDHHLDIILSGVLTRYEHNLFVSSRIQKLAEYDQKNGTELLHTLTTYLRNFNHPARTAAELFIDRSSMKNRIEQIETVIDVDVDDEEVAKRLRIAIKVYEAYIGMLLQERCMQ